MKAEERPVNLNLFKFKFPIPAITSILHRLSGVILFLYIPWAMYLLHSSLLSHHSFHDVQYLLQNPWIRLLNWIFLSALALHFVAGIRHIIMDLGWFESVPAGTATAIIVIILSAILIILAGVWLW